MEFRYVNIDFYKGVFFMNNNKSLLSKIVKYVLILLFVVGGVFGIYSYMNNNSNEPQVRVE